MNRTAARALHRATCRDSDCDHCERLAEARAEDQEPDYNPSAAATQYERQHE